MSLTARLVAGGLVIAAVLATLWGYGRRERLVGRAEVQAQWDADKAERMRQAFDAFRSSERAGNAAGARHEAAVRAIRKELAHVSIELEQALQRPISCPPAGLRAGDVPIPGELGVRLNAIRAAGAASAAASESAR
jgi:hypothetical protein